MPESEISAIFGLGNPGPRYENNRHNAGFLFLDWLSASRGVRVLETCRRNHAEARKAEVFGRPVTLVKPMTFMNLSGDAFRGWTGSLRLKPCQTIVVYDDLDLPFGTLRVRARGSSGGHKGMESIILEAGTDEIPRVRFGIGSADRPLDAVGFVLSDFTPSEMAELPDLFKRVRDALRTALAAGLQAAMNRFNQAPRSKKDQVAAPSQTGPDPVDRCVRAHQEVPGGGGPSGIPVTPPGGGHREE